MTPSQPDVVIVGAGIIGAACAYEISRIGRRVLVIDPQPAGSGTTAAAMGHIVVMDDSEAQFALSRYSQRLWEDLLPELPDNVEYDPCGTLWLAQNDVEMAAASVKCSYFLQRGIEAEILDSAALREAEPNLSHALLGGLRIPNDFVIYPPTAAEWLLEQACQNGATTEIGRVTSIDGSGVMLEDGSRRDAEKVVNAAGGDALDLIESPLTVITTRPRKGHLLITDRYPEFCRHQLVELGYLHSAHGHDESSVAFNLQPRKTGQMLLGSSRQFDTVTTDVEPQMVRRMIERAREFVPRIDDLKTIRAWTGFRSATPDSLPVIGPLPEDNNILLACGHEGLGIATAMATGRLIADHVAERPSEIDATPYRPDRVVLADA